MTQEPRCPVAGMVSFEREFLAKCHAEAHHRSVKAGEPPVPCVHCGWDYLWHVLHGVYWKGSLEFQPTLFVALS